MSIVPKAKKTLNYKKGNQLVRLFSSIIVEGEQNGLPQNVPLWHVDYFELNTINSYKTQEGLYLPLNFLKEFRSRSWSKKGTITRDNNKECGVGGSLAGPVSSKSPWSPIVAAECGKHLFTKHLLFPFSCEFSSFPV